MVTTGPLCSTVCGSVPVSTLYLRFLQEINSLLWSVFHSRNPVVDLSLMYPLPVVTLKLMFIYLSLNQLSAHKTLVRD